MYFIRVAAVVLLCFGLLACANGYKQFYNPTADARTMQDVQILGPGEEPKIYRSIDLQGDAKIAISKGYTRIGFASFNGAIESEQKLIAQAKDVGAVMVLVNAKFTESRSITMPLFVPNNQTTYSSGSVTGPLGTANYSGTSTTYGSTVVPITTQQQRFDQNAIFFVKSTKKLRFGMFLGDLTPELRARYERNTGALVNIVGEDSPAFNANVLPGDILTDVNGTSITSAKQGIGVLSSSATADGKYILKFIRNGAEKSIEIHLNP